MAGASNLAAVQDAQCREAQTCVAAFQAVANLGAPNVQLETDSAHQVKTLTSDDFDLSAASVLFREARTLIALRFELVEVMYTPRSCNSCAHELARSSLVRDPDQCFAWQDPLPVFVSVLLVCDLAEPNVNE